MVLAMAVPASAHAVPPDHAEPSHFPELHEVVRLAKEHAPSTVSARAGVAIGKAGYAGARLAPFANPVLEIHAERGTMGTKDVAIEGELWIPVELSGQRGARIAAVDAYVAWQTEALGAARAAAAGGAVRAYGAAVVAAERVRTFERIASVSRDEAEVYRQRLGAGDATQTEATLANVELARNRITLRESRADLTHALTELRRVTGVPTFGEPTRSPEPPMGPTGDPRAFARRSATGSPHVTSYTREATYYAREKQRQAREASSPVSVILQGGRGDLGEARFGGGIAIALPVARRNQGEQAKADAERLRAIAEREATKRAIETTVEGLFEEREEVRAAIEELATQAKPAAQAAIDAALATQQAGKGELLAVLTARRDFALLETRRLELLEREWTILGDLVALTGELP
jgi:cobalt-zinc-cadmium efflux system outer membrane protein